MDLTLVIMAAGLGSRFGGLKQVEPVGPAGEWLIDYSIYDAALAGFTKVIFVIRQEMREAFEKTIGRRASTVMDVSYVVQTADSYLPTKMKILSQRAKPWGTGHAVLCCKDLIHGPFACVNADDFYGRRSYALLADYLRQESAERRYCMVGFELSNTITENGSVSRGICTVDTGGYLQKVTERTCIERHGDVIQFTEDGKRWDDLQKDTVVSLNIWGFQSDFLGELEASFYDFLTSQKDNLHKAEFYLPAAVDTLIQNRKAAVKVRTSPERWLGVTYREDQAIVQSALRQMSTSGVYPTPLWNL